MWLGGVKGLGLYLKEQDTIVRIAPDEIRTNILYITPIDTSHLLIATEQEVLLFDLQKYYETEVVEYITYNQHNGFLGIENGQNGAFKDSKNNIWLPTTNMVVKVNPEKLKPKDNELNTCIHSIQILSEDKINPRIENHISRIQELAKPIHLTYDENNIQINFKAITFAEPQTPRYIWKLEGRDTDWSVPSLEEQVIFTGLKAGDYEFKVKAINTLGTTEATEATLFFSISPPWWWTIWAKLLWVSLLGAVVYALYYLLQTRKKNKQLEQEKEKLEEQKRQLELANLEQQLKEKEAAEIARQNELYRLQQEVQPQKIKLLQSQMDPHFIDNALNRVEGLIYSGKTAKAMDYIRSLSHLVQHYLRMSRDDHKTIALALEIQYLKLYIQIEQLRFDYPIHIQWIGEKTVDPNIEVPPLLLQPFVENVFQHAFDKNSREGFLELTFEEQGHCLICTISDNGRGRKATNGQRNKNRTRSSYANRIIHDRIIALKASGDFDIAMKIEDLYPQKSTNPGTRVRLQISIDDE